MCVHIGKYLYNNLANQIMQESMDNLRHLVLSMVTFPLPILKNCIENIPANRGNKFKLFQKLKSI